MEDSSPKGKARDLSKQETREALIRAGMDAFSEQGVDLPSLDAICARAGFTRGAFYVHFKDRDDFLEVIVDRVLNQFLDFVIAGDTKDDIARTVDRFLMAAAQGSVPLQGRRHLINQLLARGLQRSKDMATRYRTLMGDALGRLERAADAGQEAGTVRMGVDPDMVALLLVAAALGFTTLLDAGIKVDFERVKRDLHKLIEGR
jgi:TetR/AcrR family transcriptional repressor of nem operon